MTESPIPETAPEAAPHATPEASPRAHPLRDSVEDLAAVERAPDTPQTRSSTFRLAFADDEFLLREELRAVRLQLELLKPQLVLDEEGVETTVVLFGGARIPEAAKASAAATPTLATLSRFYEEARRFAAQATEA